jgi:aminoglycoside 3-N-acetyltransferase
LHNGVRQWCEFDELEWDSRDFTCIGEEFASKSGLVKQGLVGQANTSLMPQRELVDFAARWMQIHR